MIKVTEKNNQGIVVANLYAPCSNKEKIEFFQACHKIIEQYRSLDKESPLICMGDLICVVDNKLDIVSGDIHNVTVVQHFHEFVANLDIHDSFRLKYPNVKAYTWCRGCPEIARRLDYIFVHESLIPFREHAEIKSLAFSDHRAVVILLKFRSFERGPGIYKMNTSLLTDQNYVNIMNRTIDQTLDDNKLLDPHLLWESLKIEIKE